jgi:putative transposase
MSERREQIQSEHPLTKTRRGQLLDVARSSAYYCPEPVSEEDLMLMRLIDEIHLRWPFYGSRRIRDALEEHGHWVNRKRVQRLMRLMDLRALYPRRRTSQPGKGHKIYPYLLRGLTIDRPDQVWATDITYVPMAKGFIYLVAILDWHSRRVLSWRISNTLDTGFCIEALEEALQRHGAPDIFNTDQGLPVHLTGLHRRSQSPPCRDQHGRQRPVGRQCFRGAAVAQRQVRRCVFARLRIAHRAARRAGSLL